MDKSKKMSTNKTQKKRLPATIHNFDINKLEHGAFEKKTIPNNSTTYLTAPPSYNEEKGLNYETPELRITRIFEIKKKNEKGEVIEGPSQWTMIVEKSTFDEHLPTSNGKTKGEELDCFFDEEIGFHQQLVEKASEHLANNVEMLGKKYKTKDGYRDMEFFINELSAKALPTHPVFKNKTTGETKDLTDKPVCFFVKINPSGTYATKFKVPTDEGIEILSAADLVDYNVWGKVLLNYYGIYVGQGCSLQIRCPSVVITRMEKREQIDYQEETAKEVSEENRKKLTANIDLIRARRNCQPPAQPLRQQEMKNLLPPAGDDSDEDEGEESGDEDPGAALKQAAQQLRKSGKR